MNKNIKAKAKSNEERFKLQIDYKTIIIVKSKEAVKMWLSKFPNAKLVAA
jgi:hypothetical protein